MILPIHIYGDPVLRQRAEAVREDSVELQALIDNMIDTMEGASGLGLAAPQVGESLRLFVADLSPVVEDVLSEAEEEGYSIPVPFEPIVFINPEILSEGEEDIEMQEGCLSIPGLHEIVVRPYQIRMKYLDRHFEEQELDSRGYLARVIQHEFDHINGVLFVDRISAFRRKMLRRRLREMMRGDVEADYPVLVSKEVKKPEQRSAAGR